ncbi:Protein HIR [[Candida] zeylanoides]
MHILKLPWFGHKADDKKSGCYSVAMNATGTRLASGGLDGNVRIWDPRSILCHIGGAAGGAAAAAAPAAAAAAAAAAGAPPRALCTMSRHNGAVTCVKFSPHGRFLASGSDDKIVLIWERDDTPVKQFGDGDLERWTVRKRLVAHDNDVQDIAWSPDGALLVTVGLDRSIIIWSGYTFERIKRYDIHQSMVKGIVFDPANKFFATASDDRTVRIFRYHRKHPSRGEHEFQMEHMVTAPFKKSPLTSYFRRMSWSPDGQHIAVPNATNGPVTSVCVVHRGNWSTDISLIGHEAPCEVCAFSPRLFQTSGKTAAAATGDYSTVVATAGQDLSLVVWSTAVSKPLVVAGNIVDDSVTDLCWAPSGETLYVSCLDGLITCVQFEPGELGWVAPVEINDEQLGRFGTDRESAVFAESVEQLRLERGAAQPAAAAHAATMEPTQPLESPKPAAPPAFVSRSFGPGAAPDASEKPTDAATAAAPTPSPAPPPVPQHNPVTITKDGRKRVAPLVVSSSRPTVSTFSPKPPTTRFDVAAKLSRTSYALPRLGVATAVHGLKSRQPADPSFAAQDDDDNDNEEMGILEDAAEPVNGVVSDTTRRRLRNKHKRSVMEARYPSALRLVSGLPVFLFHHPALINESLSTVPREVGGGDWSVSTTYDPNDEYLVFSVVSSALDDLVVEVRNGPSWPTEDNDVDYNDRVDFQDPTVCTISRRSDLESRCYTLYLPYKVQHAVPLGELFGLISFAGTLQLVRARSGTLFGPSLELGSNVVVVRHSGPYLSCVTSAGLVYVWRVGERLERVVGGVPVASLWTVDVRLAGSSAAATAPPTLSAYEVDPHTGAPLVMLEDGDVFEYSVALMSWTKVCDPWYFSALDEAPPLTDTVRSRLARRSYAHFCQNVKRKAAAVYDDAAAPLKRVMRQRYHELASS